MMKTNGHSRPMSNLIAKAYATPRYRGRRVIILHGTIFPSRSGLTGFRQLKSLVKHYPDETPMIVYVPKADTLILSL